MIVPHTLAVSLTSPGYDLSFSFLRPFVYFALSFLRLPFIMRAFTFVSFAAAALFGSQVLAAPLEPHMIAKREDVCKIKIRSVSNNDCLQNNQGNNYTWTAPSNIAMKSVTVSLYHSTSL